MPRLSVSERRMIAIEFQVKGLSFTALRKKYGRKAVDRWKNVDYCAPDEDFSDETRSGRPKVLTKVQERAMMKGKRPT